MPEPTTTATAPITPPATTSPTAPPKKLEAPNQLGKDSFLKLLVTQLRHQDPLDPVKDQDFMAQMAQFTSLEQLTNLNKTFETDRAFGLIGRNVTYTGKDGVAATGVVEKVVLTDGKTTLTVGGVSAVDPNAVTEVR